MRVTDMNDFLTFFALTMFSLSFLLTFNPQILLYRASSGDDRTVEVIDVWSWPTVT